MVEATYAADARLFDRIAREGRRTRLSIGQYEAIYRQMGLLPWVAGREEGARFLEIGACDGLHTGNLARLTGRAGVGVDVSAAALAVAREEARRDDLSASYTLGDALALPFAEGTFETVLFFDTLHHFFFKGFDAAVTEAARVLAPGGRLFFAELNVQYPYHVVAFGGAQVLKAVHRVDFVERTFTDNEFALWPRKIARSARRAGLVMVPGSVGYFPYVELLPPDPALAEPLPLKLVRCLCGLLGRLGGKATRYDCLHLAMKKPDPGDA